jgi:hypothetical protein
MPPDGRCPSGSGSKRKAGRRTELEAVLDGEFLVDQRPSWPGFRRSRRSDLVEAWSRERCEEISHGIRQARGRRWLRPWPRACAMGQLAQGIQAEVAEQVVGQLREHAAHGVVALQARLRTRPSRRAPCPSCIRRRPCSCRAVRSARQVARAGRSGAIRAVRACAGDMSEFAIWCCRRRCRCLAGISSWRAPASRWQAAAFQQFGRIAVDLGDQPFWADTGKTWPAGSSSTVAQLRPGAGISASISAAKLQARPTGRRSC